MTARLTPDRSLLQAGSVISPIPAACGRRITSL